VTSDGQSPDIKQLASRIVYQNQYMTLREDQIERRDGSKGLYSLVEKPDFSLVIPVESDGFWLVEQFRYPVRARSWEFPQGTFPQGKDGTAEELAIAELAEETGITAGSLEKIGFLHCAKGLSNQGFHIFVANDLQHGRPHREAEEQDMIQKWFSRTALEKMISTCEVTDDSTIAAFALFMLRG